MSSCHLRRHRPPPALDQQARAAGASDQSAELTNHPRLHCCYRSKQCYNERALKLSGECHKLCEYHQRRVNLNQQYVHQRRKMRLKQSERLASLSSSVASSPRYKTDGMGASTGGAFSALDHIVLTTMRGECPSRTTVPAAISLSTTSSS